MPQVDARDVNVPLCHLTCCATGSRGVVVEHAEATDPSEATDQHSRADELYERCRRQDQGRTQQVDALPNS